MSIMNRRNFIQSLIGVSAIPGVLKAGFKDKNQTFYGVDPAKGKDSGCMVSGKFQNGIRSVFHVDYQGAAPITLKDLEEGAKRLSERGLRYERPQYYVPLKLQSFGADMGLINSKFQITRRKDLVL